jgi:TolB-like protein
MNVRLIPPALLLALQLLPSTVSAQEDGRKVVAVLPFASPGLVREMGESAQPTFTTELVKSRKVRVVDEKRIQQAVQRFERDQSGLFDQKKIKEMGKFLKADYVVAGELAPTGDAFTMTVQVTNVETLEIELAEDVDFRNASKLRLAVRAAAQKIAALISGEGRASGKHEAFFNIDARQFYDTAAACISALDGLDAWRYEGEIDEERDGRQVHVKLRAGNPKPGMPLQVFEEGLGDNDKPIGVVYVLEPDEAGGGFIAQWIKEQDEGKKKRGDFGLGARVSNARYRYRIAIGKLVDEAEDNAKLVDMFRDKLHERLDESSKFLAKTGSEVTQTALELGRGDARKKALAKLHAAGVDFLVEGKFIGEPGSRRADFKVISTFTGEVWGELAFETAI